MVKMTKEEAILLMRKGVKMTHTFFSPEEWVTIKDEKMLFEDGCTCSQTLFWKDRKLSGWESGWSKWEDKKMKKSKDGVISITLT